MIEIFYDGNCIVCDTEILYYKRIIPDKIKIKDISAEGFNSEFYNLDSKLINKFMHIKIGDKVYSKIEAFTYIWEQLPDSCVWFKFLLKISKIKPIRVCMDIVYIIFAYLRPYFPTKK